MSLEMFNLEIVPYHTLCLYVEYAVLCGNKVLLNLNLKFEHNATGQQMLLQAEETPYLIMKVYNSNSLQRL